MDDLKDLPTASKIAASYYAKGDAAKIKKALGQACPCRPLP
jgi:hypothetical protein